MTDSAIAARLARTYHCRVNAFRPLCDGSEERIWENRPCALSRTAKITAPLPPSMAAVLPEAGYRLALYTLPEVTFQIGDRLEITDSQGRVYFGRASDSFCYPSHAVTVVELLEVKEATAL